MPTELANIQSPDVSEAEPVVALPGRSPSEAGAENRWARRTSTRIGAQIIHESLAQPMLCTVRDTSSTGARLEIANSRGGISRDRAPDRFTLVMPADRTMVECTVAWRRGNLIGVRYTSPARRAPKPERKEIPEVKKPGAKLLSMLLNPV